MLYEGGMSDQDAFERILASLYDAMLDDAEWPATSALIDEACGTVGNALLVGEGPPADIRDPLRPGLLPSGAIVYEDLEREWLETCTTRSTNACRGLRQLPDSQPGPHPRPVHR